MYDIDKKIQKTSQEILKSWGDPESDKILKAFLRKPSSLPNPLYHYTTPAGALGILEEKIIRASNAVFLNDSEEIRFALRIASDICLELADSPKYHHLEKSVLRDTGLRLIDGPIHEYSNIFVACFSRNGDDLSQWRGYGRDGRGVSLGFNTRALVKLLENQKIRFVKINYKKDQAKQKIRSILESWHKNVWSRKMLFKECINITPSDEEMLSNMVRGLGWALRLVLRRVAACFKDPAFKSEWEFRAIVRLTNQNLSKRVKFVPRDDMLRPYVEMNLSNPGIGIQRAPIDTIKIGPSAHSDLSATSMRLFLRKLKYEDAGGMIEKSIVPFRPF